MLKKLDKRGQAGISQLPGFFQIMLLVVVFAGLTFIVLDKFLGVSYDDNTAGIYVNETIGNATTTGKILAADSLRNGACGTITLVVNITGVTIAPGNYTQIGCTVYNATNVSTLGTYWKVTYPYTHSTDTMASNAINDSTGYLYDYGIGFLGIVILVVMVYLIISIVSGRRSGAK